MSEESLMEHRCPTVRVRMLPWAPFLLLPVACFAMGGGEDPAAPVVHRMAVLVLQFGAILLAAKAGGGLAARLRQPTVIGELLAGILVGPHLLGCIPLPGFPEGFFPLPPSGQSLPVSTELYGLASIASVLLLFNAGLETDLAMLRRFSVAGAVVGAGGVVISFVGGAAVTAAVSGTPLLSPLCLFMGAIATATSVGVTARVLQDTRAIDSAEGVTVLAAAVIDDVLGIVVLAIVIALDAAAGRDGSFRSISWGHIGLVALKALAVWLGATAVGLLFATRLATMLKRLGSVAAFSVVAFALGLLVAGLFERAGLAMIIGAYVAGLVLSGTDLRYVIGERLHGLSAVLVPAFFAVTGSFVDLRLLGDPGVLALGAAYAVACIAAKVLGAGGAALFVGFNRLGALRIGIGMAARSEVALIIASTGLAYHVLTPEAFGATVIMVLASVLVTPALFEKTLRHTGRGTRHPVSAAERVSVSFNFPTTDLADLLTGKVVQYFRNEGFFTHYVAGRTPLYHFNKEQRHVALSLAPKTLSFEMAADDVVLVRTMVYEALLNLHEAIGTLKHAARPETLRGEMVKSARARKVSVRRALRTSCTTPELKATDKVGVVRELIGMLARAGQLTDEQAALDAVVAREQAMSTGLQDGVAIPHARTNAVDTIRVAVGLKKDGVDFQSIDGKPSSIFVLVLSPLNAAAPHIEFVAEVATRLSSEDSRQRLLASRTSRDIVAFFGEAGTPEPAVHTPAILKRGIDDIRGLWRKPE